MGLFSWLPCTAPYHGSYIYPAFVIAIVAMPTDAATAVTATDAAK